MAADGYFVSPRMEALAEVLDTKFQFSINHMTTKWDFHVVGLDKRVEVAFFLIKIANYVF